MTTEFNMATAEKPAMKLYANNELGLSLTMSMSEATMRERITKHCVENDLPLPTAKIEMKRAAGKNKDVKYIKIKIAQSEKPGGTEPAFVGVQGVGYMIPRGIEVEVPASVVEVLKNAVQDIVTQDDEGVIYHNDMPTYPFSVIAA